MNLKDKIMKTIEINGKIYKVLPFDIEKAQNGAKVVNKKGETVKIVHTLNCFNKYKILGIVEKSYEEIETYTFDGMNYESKSNNDLIIIEELTETWQQWTEQPFKSMFEAQKWEFRKKNFKNVISFAMGVSDTHIQISRNHLLFWELFNDYEMRTENGEWQPCGNKLIK